MKLDVYYIDAFADNVFAGMNAQSMRGNVFTGARKRISKRQETSKKLTGEKKERFDKKRRPVFILWGAKC